MASSGTKLFGLATTTLVVVVVVAAFIANYLLLNPLNRGAGQDQGDRLDQVLSGLLHVETQADSKYYHKPKIAIGFGACQDVVVRAVDLLDPLEETTPRHHHVIGTKQQLLEGFAYFFMHGAAAERFVENSTLFQELVAVASQDANARWTIGGNAPVMGSRLAQEGCHVLLGASMTKQLRESLHTDIEITGKDLEKDDVHLILEYPTGEIWGPFQSPRANRFIAHSDTNNPTLTGLESFQEKLKTYKPDLLIISGLQMMDNYPFKPGERRSRLDKVQEIMKSQSNQTKIHFEMASFTDESLLQELAELVMPSANSMGMNEQELTNLYHLLQYGNVSVLSDSHPRIAMVLDQMRVVFRLLRSQDNGSNRQLTRLHVHTLAYQAIMVEKGSPWKNIKAAAAKASLTAHRHTCGSKEIYVEKAQLLVDESFAKSRDERSQRVPFDPESPVACWEESDSVKSYNMKICIAPVLVCTKVLQTAGGGDNISSAGLVLQI